MTGSPYRSPAPRAAQEAVGAETSCGGVEEAFAKSVLLAIGSLGVVAGIVGPACDVELSLGLLALLFVARWSLSGRLRMMHASLRRPRSRSDEVVPGAACWDDGPLTLS